MGKHLERKKHRKSFILLVSLVLILVFAVGGTLAYLVTSTASIENLFNASNVSVAVTETLANGVKSNVKVQNTGNTDAYIRAAVVINWQNESGNVYGQVPTSNDYSITWNLTDTGWFQGNDGFYYYKNAVAPTKTTEEALITSCTWLNEPPADGYTLTVEILASGIQASPKNAVESAWGVSVDDNSKTISK